MIFLLFNSLVLLCSLALTYAGFANLSLVKTLPVGIEALILLGFIMAILNLYDSIKNFVIIAHLLAKADEDEN
jgi:hypothetical protein